VGQALHNFMQIFNNIYDIGYLIIIKIYKEKIKIA